MPWKANWLQWNSRTEKAMECKRRTLLPGWTRQIRRTVTPNEVRTQMLMRCRLLIRRESLERVPRLPDFVCRHEKIRARHDSARSFVEYLAPQALTDKAALRNARLTLRKLDAKHPDMVYMSSNRSAYLASMIPSGAEVNWSFRVSWSVGSQFAGPVERVEGRLNEARAHTATVKCVVKPRDPTCH